MAASLSDTDKVWDLMETISIAMLVTREGDKLRSRPMAAYVARGCHLSYAGPVSWAEARKPLEALRLTPRDRLLVETDAPDQAPAPHRGGRNEPAFLVRVIEATAAALGESVEATGALVARNARRLFPAFSR